MTDKTLRALVALLEDVVSGLVVGGVCTLVTLAAALASM